MAFAERIRAELARLEQDGLYRRRRIVDSAAGPELRVDGRPFLAFCSNDYLGLANHPEVNAAFRAGVARWGTGSGAAHLVTGHTAAHHALEEALADFVGRPRALLFSTGYMANLGTVAALCGRGDTVIEDRLNHASLLDAGLLAGGRLIRYAHAAPEDLDARLAGRASGAKLVVTDGVFSMDGDLAPLPALVEVARRHEAWLMVDDAHGLGVLGAEGRGTLEHFGLPSTAVPVLIGTLGKAFGTAGAFVAGEADLIELLIQRARPYIYTTASPPALAEATRAALRIAGEEAWRRERLHAVVGRFRAGAAELGLPLLPSSTPIQPLVLGAPGRALAWMRRLEDEGIVVQAIRPPTVPAGTARLRITLSAAHTDAQLDRLLDALAATARAEDR